MFLILISIFKLENAQKELFKERRDNRLIIEELEASLEAATKYPIENRSSLSQTHSDILIEKAQKWVKNLFFYFSKTYLGVR